MSPKNLNLYALINLYLLRVVFELTIEPKSNILLHKYLGYYILHNQSIIYSCARGTAQKNLEMDIFKLINNNSYLFGF